MKERMPRVLIYSALLLVAFTLLQQLTHLEKGQITPQGGMVDLTALDLSSELVEIAPEEWAYYPGRLYAPDDFANDDVIEPVYGDNAAQAEFGTYKLSTRLESGKLYAVSGHTFPFSQRVFIDGHLAGEVGAPGESREETTPASKTYVYYFQAENERTEFIFQVANFYHREGARNVSVLIAEPALMDRYHSQELIQTNIVFGCLITLFLYLLGVYIFFHRRHYFLFLALFSLATAVRMLLIGEKHIMTVFPGLNWISAMRMEYLCLILLVVFLQLYFASLYPKMLNKAYLGAIVGLSAAYAIIVLCFDSLIFTRLLGAYTAVWVIASIVTLWRLAWQLRQGDLHTALIFLGLMVFAATTLYDELAYYLVLHIRLHNTLITGVLVCVFLNVIALTLDFSETEMALKRTELMRQELDETNQLLDRLSEMKTDYLADMSHEMRTPLTVISANAQLSKALIQAGAEEGEIIHYLDVIMDESGRLARMASGLLELNSSNETMSGMERLDIHTLLKSSGEAYRALIEKKGNRLTVELPDTLPPVRGNADMLLQVVTNLFSNANRHTSGGKIILSAVVKENQVMVSVRDTGEGIVPEVLPRVFERNVQEKKSEGKGLGLWICHTIVLRHGGTIEIESERGAGTTVRFVLPVNKEDRK